MRTGGALAGPVTAFQYDWNMLPIGQQLWLEWFETLQGVPAVAGAGKLQPHQVMDQIQMTADGHPSD